MIPWAGPGLFAADQSTRPEVQSQPAPEREFRLFVGLNLEVEQANEFSVVDDYSNNRVSTDKLAGDLVSLRNVDGMRFTHSPKLSRNPLSIGEINTEEIVGTAEAARDAMRNHQILADTAAAGAAAHWQTMRTLGAPDLGGDAAPASDLEIAQEGAKAYDAMRDFADVASKMTDPALYGEAVATGDGQTPTALLITTQISSPVPVTDAYLIGVARIWTEEERSRDVVFFHAIDRLGPKPRQVRITKQGLPQGFEVKSVEIHVYHQGQELVSDKSVKQFALTRDEMIEYLVLERTSTNRGLSLPAEPAWALAPTRLLATSNPEEVNFPLTVQVSANGQVTGIDQNTIAPPAVAELVQELLFLPALENGTAVAANANVNLADYFR